MRIELKKGLLAGASIAFLAFSSAFMNVTPATAGPLTVTPKANVTLPLLTEQVQYRRSVRRARVHHTRNYYGGRRYAYRRASVSPFFPAAVLGLFAGVLGAAAYGGSAYCDPAYYSWNYGGGCGVYRPAYYPAYGAGYYYPAFARGYYPAYRGRRVIYRSSVHRPRTVRYRAVAPRRHFVGARTHVRAGYTVRRARR